MSQGLYLITAFIFQTFNQSLFFFFIYSNGYLVLDIMDDTVETMDSVTVLKDFCFHSQLNHKLIATNCGHWS